LGCTLLKKKKNAHDSPEIDSPLFIGIEIRLPTTLWQSEPPQTKTKKKLDVLKKKNFLVVFSHPSEKYATLNLGGNLPHSSG